jgi:hypothetical protein
MSSIQNNKSTYGALQYFDILQEVTQFLEYKDIFLKITLLNKEIHEMIENQTYVKDLFKTHFGYESQGPDHKKNFIKIHSLSNKLFNITGHQFEQDEEDIGSDGPEYILYENTLFFNPYGNEEKRITFNLETFELITFKNKELRYLTRINKDYYVYWDESEFDKKFVFVKKQSGKKIKYLIPKMDSDPEMKHEGVITCLDKENSQIVNFSPDNPKLTEKLKIVFYNDEDKIHFENASTIIDGDSGKRFAVIREQYEEIDVYQLSLFEHLDVIDSKPNTISLKCTKTFSNINTYKITNKIYLFSTEKNSSLKGYLLETKKDVIYNRKNESDKTPYIGITIRNDFVIAISKSEILYIWKLQDPDKPLVILPLQDYQVSEIEASDMKLEHNFDLQNDLDFDGVFLLLRNSVNNFIIWNTAKSLVPVTSFKLEFDSEISYVTSVRLINSNIVVLTDSGVYVLSPKQLMTQ